MEKSGRTSEIFQKFFQQNRWFQPPFLMFFIRYNGDFAEPKIFSGD